ncbi:MAG: recombination-associated protein RdgC [Thermodesulfobacteriota bacterium]|nr:recombination-associated protein RdgC [Thermodesulfobacteriota bacterium]
MANTVSICQYRVDGALPEQGEGFFSWVGECLSNNRFISIDEVADEESTGWVRMDDPMDADFSDDSAFRHDDYICFSLRQDRRKVPSSMLKNLVGLKCTRWLQERPALKKVPVKVKSQMKEDIHSGLLSKTLPTPSTCDLLWDTRTGIVSIATVSPKTLDLVEDEFSSTFDGVSLVPVHPVERARMVLDEGSHEALTRANKAPSRDVLTQIKENQWVGWEFFLWLMCRSDSGDSRYQVNQEGPLPEGAGFIAYLYDRFVLMDRDNEDLRKSSIIGPQKKFAEARRAMQDGKNIVEGVIYMEREDYRWKITLKGETFAFGSYRCPAVKIETDAQTDPDMEKEAVFFERMSLMEIGLQMFDSVFSAFLEQRLKGDWDAESKRLGQWLND